MRKSKSKIKAFVVAVIFILIVAVAIVMGYRAAQQSEYEYRLAAHPKKYSEYVSKYAQEYEMD